MRRAQVRDSVSEKKFYFRTNISSTCESSQEPVIKEMTINQILNGDEESKFPGLLPICQVLFHQENVQVMVRLQFKRQTFADILHRI